MYLGQGKTRALELDVQPISGQILIFLKLSTENEILTIEQDFQDCVTNTLKDFSKKLYAKGIHIQMIRKYSQKQCNSATICLLPS